MPDAQGGIGEAVFKNNTTMIFDAPFVYFTKDFFISCGVINKVSFTELLKLE